MAWATYPISAMAGRLTEIAGSPSRRRCWQNESRTALLPAYEDWPMLPVIETMEDRQTKKSKA
jgi:hypothetical protein